MRKSELSIADFGLRIVELKTGVLEFKSRNAVFATENSNPEDR